jgi:uncharacterized protein YbaP (TraB family)
VRLIILLRASLVALLLLATNAWADPAVWRVSTSEDSELWLLGSVHYLREQDHPLPDVIERLYARADALVMEIDLDDLDPASIQTQFMLAALLPASSPLSSVVDADVYRLAESTAGSLGLDIAALARVEPWLVALTLMDLGMTQLGYRSDQGLEQYLLERAQRDRKPIYGLETVTDQVRVFDGLTPAEQEALLEQTLSELDSAGREMDELLTAWRDGSLATLTDKLSASFKEFPGLYETLVIDRNRNWLPELERLAAQPGRHLVVVGALHLVGENSVVDLLRERGVSVEPYALPD